mmetsp:Transcript_108720/g.350987  ORF Transcript_108720/g.350987 Transcript_108720/m.350987 type:complete len:465 (-) Transcript_108720:1-1395(-)
MLHEAARDLPAVAHGEPQGHEGELAACPWPGGRGGARGALGARVLQERRLAAGAQAHAAGQARGRRRREPRGPERVHPELRRRLEGVVEELLHRGVWPGRGIEELRAPCDAPGVELQQRVPASQRGVLRAQAGHLALELRRARAAAGTPADASARASAGAPSAVGGLRPARRPLGTLLAALGPEGRLLQRAGNRGGRRRRRLAQALGMRAPEDEVVVPRRGQHRELRLQHGVQGRGWRACVSPPGHALLAPPQHRVQQVLHLLQLHGGALLREVAQAALVEATVPVPLQQRLQLREEHSTGRCCLAPRLWPLSCAVLQDDAAERLVHGGPARQGTRPWRQHHRVLQGDDGVVGVLRVDEAQHVPEQGCGSSQRRGVAERCDVQPQGVALLVLAQQRLPLHAAHGCRREGLQQLAQALGHDRRRHGHGHRGPATRPGGAARARLWFPSGPSLGLEAKMAASLAQA